MYSFIINMFVKAKKALYLRLMVKLLRYIVLILTGTSVWAQIPFQTSNWKKYRKEVYFNAGTSGFLGDLGGAEGIGTTNSFKDFNPSSIRYSVAVGGRYRLNEFLNVSGKLSNIMVSGDDALSKDLVRKNRNLNFKSNIIEISARIEGGLFLGHTGGSSGWPFPSMFETPKKTSLFSDVDHYLYAFTGIGAFYFNPKGKNPTTNEWIDLYPLKTEGQGLPNGPEEYSKIAMNIPLGITYKAVFKKQWSFLFEICYRKTFTDYIDDVSGYYYKPSEFKNSTITNPDLSILMSNPSIGGVNYWSDPANTSNFGRAKRGGNGSKDSYFTIEIGIGYTFKELRKTAALQNLL